MLFDVYGDNAVYQWIGWITRASAALIGVQRTGPTHENRRRHRASWSIPGHSDRHTSSPSTRAPPRVPSGRSTTPPIVHMNSWFHYAKLYAATVRLHRLHGSEVSSGDRIGKSHWFKCFPFVIVAINILIAVVSRLRIRHPRLGHHVGLQRRRDAVRRLAQRIQRRCRPAEHLLHDRLVGHLRVQEEAGHALAGHDLGVHS